MTNEDREQIMGQNHPFDAYFAAVGNQEAAAILYLADVIWLCFQPRPTEEKKKTEEAK